MEVSADRTRLRARHRCYLSRLEILLKPADVREAHRTRPVLVPIRAAPRTVPIIGGGPAGMSCALWLKNYGLRPVLIEKEPELGGMQRRSPYKNDWLLGRQEKSARENAADFARHVRKAGVEIFTAAQTEALARLDDELFETTVLTSGGFQKFESAAVVIATGTAFRCREWIDQVRGAEEVMRLGRLHIGPACAGEPGADFGSKVLVVGGGDNAFDVANYLAEKGIKVTLAVRSVSARAQLQLQDRLAKFQRAGLVEVLAPTTVTALVPSNNRVIATFSSGAPIGIDHVILTLGYTPNSGQDFLQGLSLGRGRLGYLAVGANAETSCPGIFAIGDVSNPEHPCTATAIAAGTVAARSIQRRIQVLDGSLTGSVKQEELRSGLDRSDSLQPEETTGEVAKNTRPLRYGGVGR